MAIEFNCPHCLYPYRLKDKCAGKRAICKDPDCRQVIVIPKPVTVIPKPVTVPEELPSAAECRVAELVEKLNNSDVDARRKAARELTCIGSPTIRTLRKALRKANSDPDSTVRLEVVRGLRASRHPTSIPLLMESADRERPEVLQEIQETLADFRDSLPLSDLIETFRQDLDSHDKERLFQFCMWIGPRALPTMVPILQDPDPFLRLLAANVVGQQGDPAAIPVLFGSINGMSDFDHILKVIRFIKNHIGEPAIPALTKLLESLKGSVKIQGAAIAIVEIRGHSLSALSVSLRDTNEHVRYQAARVLNNVEGGRSVLIDALEDQDANVCLLAANSFLWLDESKVDKSIVAPALTRSIQRLKGSQRKGAIKVLLHIDRDAACDFLASTLPEQFYSNEDKLTQNLEPYCVVESENQENEACSLSSEDSLLLKWFACVDLQKYLKFFQVFWCIGYVESDAIAKAGIALSYEDLKESLRKLKPQFKHTLLPTGVTYIRKECIPAINWLFDKEPFYSQAWSEEERDLPLREDRKSGEGNGVRWTLKTDAAWRLVDRFLSLRNLRPEIETISEISKK